MRHVFTARLPSADWRWGRGTDSSQPGPVSKLHSTLSPLTLHMASDWSSGPIPPSHWLTRPIRDNTRGAVPRHSHTRHNQVLSPSVAKDTLALNFPKRLLMKQNGWNNELSHNTFIRLYPDIWLSRIQSKPLDCTACIMRGVISPGTRGHVSVNVRKERWVTISHPWPEPASHCLLNGLLTHMMDSYWPVGTQRSV